MNKRFPTIICVLGLLLANFNAAHAQEEAIAAAGDILVVRPVSLAATAVGAAIFLVALPFAALSHSVHDTADVLVKKPADFTFTRPLGDFTIMGD